MAGAGDGEWLVGGAMGACAMGRTGVRGRKVAGSVCADGRRRDRGYKGEGAH